MILQSIFFTSLFSSSREYPNNPPGLFGFLLMNPGKPSPNTDAVGVTGMPGPNVLKKLSFKACSIPFTEDDRRCFLFSELPS